jgi:hypothetical protein
MKRRRPTATLNIFTSPVTHTSLHRNVTRPSNYPVIMRTQLHFSHMTSSPLWLSLRVLQNMSWWVVAAAGSREGTKNWEEWTLDWMGGIILSGGCFISLITFVEHDNEQRNLVPKWNCVCSYATSSQITKNISRYISSVWLVDPLRSDWWCSMWRSAIGFEKKSCTELDSKNNESLK